MVGLLGLGLLMFGAWHPPGEVVTVWGRVKVRAAPKSHYESIGYRPFTLRLERRGGRTLKAEVCIESKDVGPKRRAVVSQSSCFSLSTRLIDRLDSQSLIRLTYLDSTDRLPQQLLRVFIGEGASYLPDYRIIGFDTSERLEVHVRPAEVEGEVLP